MRCGRSGRARKCQKADARQSLASALQEDVQADGGDGNPVSPNLLKRQFDVKEQNQVGSGDIGYVWTDKGWL